MPRSKAGHTRAVASLPVWLGDGEIPVTLAVAEEVPVALRYNCTDHAVMLATPADLEDFALGFSLSEGIVDRTGEAVVAAVEAHPKGIVVQLEIAADRFATLQDRRRTLAGRTGCGLCGVETLDEAVRPLRHLPDGPVIDPATIQRALADLPARQTLNQLTRSIHAAAWIDLAGAIVLVREDVGRHNALDKLIGAMARAGIDPAAGFVVITSRCSMEMVQKAVTVGIRVLVAVSAPTALAIRLATDINLTLAASARTHGTAVYAHPERLARRAVTVAA